MDSCCSVPFYTNNRRLILDAAPTTTRVTDSHGNSVPAQLEGVAEICFIGVNPTPSSSRKYDSSPIECTSFFRAKFFDSVLEKSSTLGLVSLVYLSSALGLALNHDNKTNPFLFHRLTGFRRTGGSSGGVRHISSSTTNLRARSSSLERPYDACSGAVCA